MTDFTTCLLRDPKLSQITDKQIYAVTQGASNSTFQQFQAVSATNSSIVFNVQVPSQSIVVNREVYIRAQAFSFHLKIENGAPGDTVFDLGLTDALAPFPLTMLFNTLSSQINNTNVSETISDILPQLLRMNDSRELYRWNSGTPTLPDQAYLNYTDAVLSNNNPLAGLNTASYDVCQVPRGAFAPKTVTLQQFTSAGILVVTATPAVIVTAGNFVIAQLAYDLIEPIFLSPFIFSNPEYNLGGLVGINTLNLVAQLNSGQRIFRSAVTGSGATAVTSTVNLGIYNVSSNPFQGQCELLLNFLSTQSTDLIPSRSVVPYMSYPRYLTTATTAISAGATTSVTSANLQLNQIPDKFIICVRKPMNTQTTKDADAFFRINTIQISLNNQSGLLSTATNYDLWRLGCESGSSQSFLEFSGLASNNNSATSLGSTVPTTGSLLVLSPSQCLSLPAMLSSGSIGQFNFQITLNVTNPYGVSITPEIVIITANSGIMVNQNGSSAVYTGILTRQMVVDTATMANVPSVEIPEYTRMVGGKMGNMGAMKKMVKHRSSPIGGVPMMGHSGGAMSGAGMGKYC